MRRIQPYFKLMRFDRPIPILHLLWPTLWALWIASDGRPDLKILMIMVSGVVVMRSAGCVINDILDRKFDGQVQRTQYRPLVINAVSVQQALILFVTLLAIAFSLVLMLNPLTITLAFLGAGLTCIYPLMKRFLTIPQLVLGAAFAWGVPMAFAAELNHVPWVGWYLFVTTLIWIVIYDTMYAMADRADDLKIGINSSAVLFGQYDVWVVMILQIVLWVLWIFLGNILHLSWIYYSCLVIVAMLFVYQQKLIWQRQPATCIKAFLSNHWVGFTVFIGLLLNYLIMQGAGLVS